MWIQLRATALNSGRYGVSDRGTAVVVSSVLRDVGMITDTESYYVADKSIIKRAKCHSIRMDLKSQFQPSEESKNLFVEGRKDDALTVEKFNDERFRQNKKEKHYSLTQEPEWTYIELVSSSSSKDISKNYFSFV